MSFSRSSAVQEFNYLIGDVPVMRVQEVRDLGVVFDPKLTFHSHVEAIVEAAYRLLGFVLRNASHLTNQALRILYTALVRSILECNSVVWNPHESKYTLMIEQVQKQFLGHLYKRQYGYYPFMYPTLFLQGHLSFDSLQLRRYVALTKFVLKINRGRVDCVYLLQRLVRFFVPTSYVRARRHALLAQPPARTQAHKHTPVIRAICLLNSVLEVAPQCDLFASSMECLVKECKKRFESLMPASAIK
ncbi:uncharacterized protein LOC126975415 [Leptidea sinapis]|uniref:uncharacterized protein LOC126975415 n=1 Tax=Leptidea sinapis TaxID=189913 RepID=UPI0021C38697|nr:uncharacterized protein LOC126975415 [Leptidea sinapis]